MNKLTKLSKAFRKAIETVDCNKLPITFSNFPRGACGDVTLLLGTFLIEHGYQPFNYMLGERNDFSHAWLELNNLIIDITADQFHDCAQTVIVSNTSNWHSLFNGKAEHAADYRIYDDNTKALLNSAYSLILEQMQPEHLPSNRLI